MFPQVRDKSVVEREPLHPEDVEALPRVWSRVDVKLPGIATWLQCDGSDVEGETSPWGLQFMTVAATAGRPGAQAYAMHVYPDNPDPGAVTREVAVLAARHGASAWATEGLCGPGAWARYGCQSAVALRADGFSLASEWYTSQAQSPTAASDPAPWTTS
jgi:hypothetical protein